MILENQRYGRNKDTLVNKSYIESGDVIFSVTDSTDKRAIIYTEKLKKAINGKKALITIHTHPSSMPPSIDDFNSSFNNEYKIGFVACHNGKVFRYTSEQEVSKTLYNLYIKEYLDENLSEYETQLKALQKLKENHEIDFSEVL